MMKTSARPLAIGLSAALLAGCSGQAIDRFQAADAVGSPFTQNLTAEYRQTVAYEADEMQDWVDAGYFARKGMRTAAGEVVEPEALEDWRLPADSVDELSTARGRLLKVLDAGARDSYPEAAAVAQAKFDCWVEQQEENHQPDHIAACRDGFLAAVAEVEGGMGVGPADYLVFFDHDSASLTEAGETALSALIDAAKAGGGAPVLTVVGHADTSGDGAYNTALSLRRAEAVKAALVSAGLTDATILVEAVGEGDLMVATPDGVREPSNRRAVIKVQ